MIIKTFEQYSQIEEKVLGVDLDGVLNNFTEGFNVIYKRYFPDSEIVPAEDIDDWNWYEKLNYDGQDPQVWFNEHKHETWYVSLPYPGAVETMKNIYEYTQSEGILLRIVTMQPTEQAKEESVRWLTKYGIKYDDIAFVNRSKEKWDNAQVQVDDSPGVLSAKPRDKVGIKVETKYNTMVNSDFNVSDITKVTPNLLDKAFEKFKNVSEGVKWYKNGKLELDKNFEVEEEKWSDDEEVWAIFMIGNGKHFLTMLVNNHFGRFNSLRYSDPKTLKFTLEKAKELVNKNEISSTMYSHYNRFGIVNDKGLQLTRGVYDKLWHRS